MRYYNPIYDLPTIYILITIYLKINIFPIFIQYLQKIRLHQNMLFYNYIKLQSQFGKTTKKCKLGLR